MSMKNCSGQILLNGYREDVLRRVKGFGYMKIAREAGFSENTLSNFFKGRKVLKSTEKAIVEALGRLETQRDTPVSLLEDVEKSQKKVLDNCNNGIYDWYHSLTLEDIETLYNHAIQGHRTSASAKSQGVFYIHFKLISKYLKMLSELDRKDEARAAWDSLQTYGWTYTSELHGERVLCRQESVSAVERMNSIRAPKQRGIRKLFLL